MKRRSLTLLLIVVVAAVQGTIAEAQQPKKVARVGYLIPSVPWKRLWPAY